MSIMNFKNYNWGQLFFELVVVFLGVTAGFLLNNWQLQRLDLSLEQKYLNGFLQDTKANSAELRSLILSDSLWLDRAKPKIMSIREGSINTDSAKSLVKMILQISKADLQTSTYEDIINSGKLNIISNYNLKKQIVDYHVTIKGMEFLDGYFYNFMNETVMPFVMSNYEIIKDRFNNPEVINSTLFSNVAAGYFSMVQQRKASYERLFNKSISLEAELIKHSTDSD